MGNQLAPLFMRKGAGFGTVRPLLVVDGRPIRYDRGSLDMVGERGMVEARWLENGLEKELSVPGSYVVSADSRRSGRPLYCIVTKQLRIVLRAPYNGDPILKGWNPPKAKRRSDYEPSTN